MFFVISVGIGAFLISLSFMYLPFIIIKPEKFSGLFMLGSLSVLYGIGLLKGFGNFWNYLLE